MPIGIVIAVAVVLIVVAVGRCAQSFFDSLQPEEQCRIQNRKCRGKGQRDH